jgi:RNA polymerase sigma factor (sigma-70 family)
MRVSSELVDLVHRARHREEAAWDELVEQFASLIAAIARSCRLGPSDAADVAQTTWLRLFESIERIREPERLPGWIATTARRECLRLLRMVARELPSGEVDQPCCISKKNSPACSAFSKVPKIPGSAAARSTASPISVRAFPNSVPRSLPAWAEMR